MSISAYQVQWLKTLKNQNNEGKHFAAHDSQSSAKFQHTGLVLYLTDYLSNWAANAKQKPGIFC